MAERSETKEQNAVRDSERGYQVVPADANQSDVPPGYKRTEVGVIPEDWNQHAVADLAIVKGGKRLPNGHTLTESATHHPYIRVADMRPGGVKSSDIKYVPDEAFHTIRNYRIYQSDIFISVAGTIGIVGEIPSYLDGANLTENADRITNINCDRKYLMYWLMSEPIQRAIESICTVGAQPKLALCRVAGFQIALPSMIEEQRAIATALSDVDALIDALDRLIAKKRDIKQATMQQLLTGETRLPGFEGEWEMKRLGDVAEVFNGYAFKSATYTDSGIYSIITIANVQDGRMDLSECSMINELPRDLRSHQRLKIGDLLISMTGNVGRVCRVNYNDCLLNQRVGLIVSHSVSKEFLYQLLKNTSFLIAMTGEAKGGAQGNLSKNDILNYQIALPADPEEQTAIATVLSDMDAEIEALERRRDKTKQIKQGMMQELLTGRTRLVEAQATEAEQ